MGGRRTEGQDIICIYEEYVLYNIFITHSVVCNVLCHTASCTVGLDSKVSRPQSKIQRHLHNMFYIIHIYIYRHIPFLHKNSLMKGHTKI